MGFFGKLFEKKICSICGGEIGLLGNRKLEDGNCCKTCANKLSDWFDDRRHSTVDQIKAQLSYREENRKNLEGFRPTLSFGDYYPIRVELVDGVPSRFLVERTDDYREENADLVSFKDLISFKIDIDEDERELKYRNSEGQEVSYKPPRYEYSYDFNVWIEVNHPYFDDMRFRLNQNTLHLETVANRSIRITTFNKANFDPKLYPEYRQYKSICDEVEDVFRAGMQGNPLPGYAPEAAPAAQSAGVEPLLKMIEQIKSAPDLGMVFNLQSEIAHQATNLPEFDWIRVKSLTEAAVEDAKQRIIAQESGSAPVQEAPKPKFCQNCGAPADGGKFCQSCGSPL